jgi:hypothetical protein
MSKFIIPFFFFLFHFAPIYFAETICDHLDNVKNKFVNDIFQENEDESPFRLDYALRTVFFSKKVISCFGVLNVYNHLPHGWMLYEGKTLCKINGDQKEIHFDDLFDTPVRKEIVRNFCEKLLKNDSTSYFFGEGALKTYLKLDDIQTFVIDDECLRIIVQPYSVRGLYDGPYVISIPYKELSTMWNPSNPFVKVLFDVIASKEYTSSWNEEKFFSDINK